MLFNHAQSEKALVNALEEGNERGLARSLHKGFVIYSFHWSTS
jgi:hypothetical protein